MKWIPTSAFKKILGLSKRLKVVYGGSSAGKTVAILPYLYQKAVDNPGEVITIVSDTLQNLKGGAMRDFEQILRGLEVWEHECWSKSESIYKLHNGSIIEFVGADNETKLRGPRRARCYINEANRVKFDVYEQINLRTEKEILLDWNPSGPFWYNEYVREQLEHDELVLNYKDNESLSEQQLEVFKQMESASTKSAYHENRWKVYGLGEWGTLEGACIKDYEVVDNIPDGYKLSDIGLDFGNNDPNAAVALYKDDSGGFLVDEVLYKPKLQIQDISKALKPFDATIFADYAWPQTINELRGLGHRIVKCKKGPDSIKAGIDMINEVDLKVTSRSKNLLNEFGLYRYKMDKDNTLVDGKFEGPDHAVDALRYVLTANKRKRQIKIY